MALNLNSPSVLLINPPVVKPCEPPAGLAKLAWALRAHGIVCRVYDAAIDGLLGLLDGPITAADTWTRRALCKRAAALDALRSPSLYRNRDRYKRAVMDTHRLIAMAGAPFDTTLSLANYEAKGLSPVRSRDLIQAAERFAANPFYGTFSKALENLFAQGEPDIVGLSINFMSQALCAFAIIGFIRKRLPAARIVCGGGLVTSWMNIPGWGDPFTGLVDEMIGGPGEGRLIELCTRRQEFASPLTGYDFSDCEWDRFLAPLRVLPYSASRGCFWKKCAFCPETAEDAAYLSVDPRIVAEDLKTIVHRHSAGLIHFLDNALSPRLLKHLIAEPPGVPWYGFVRITRHLTDPDFVRRLRRAGCVMLKLGVESGDQHVLDALSKGIEVAMASKALDMVHRAGIATYVYLLFGTPAEDEDSARRTLDFTVRHAAAIDFLNLAVFNLPAYSHEAGRLETLDFYPGDLSLYREFVHPLGWRRDRVRHFLAKSFRKPASIRAILNNDPPFFTSNHAPFINGKDG
jgi:hypothetical protein